MYISLLNLYGIRLPQGKKAKRKAREKQLVEAKRLASLQARARPARAAPAPPSPAKSLIPRPFPLPPYQRLVAAGRAAGLPARAGPVPRPNTRRPRGDGMDGRPRVTDGRSRDGSTAAISAEKYAAAWNLQVKTIQSKLQAIP